MTTTYYGAVKKQQNSRKIAAQNANSSQPCENAAQFFITLSTAMLIQKNSRLLMIGDSITDCGRARPVGEGGLFDNLGRGYVSLIDAFLTANHADQRIHVINMGVSGNTVRELRERWNSDVFDLKPNWLSVCIGINDVWRAFHSPNQIDAHISLAEYTDTLHELLHVTRPTLDGLILMSPYFIEPNRTEPMRKIMDDYGAVVRDLASEYQAVFVDTQAAFDAALQNLHPMALAWDRVHPTPAGHLLLAQAFLRELLCM